MKFATLTILIALAIAPCIVEGQDGTLVDQQIALKRLETDQRTFLALNLGLTDEESNAFWPIYDEYAAAMKKVSDRRLGLLNEYAAKYRTLRNTDAEAMLATIWVSEHEALGIREKYAKKVQGVLPGVKALRYSQLQARLDYDLMSRVISLVPLAQ